MFEFVDEILQFKLCNWKLLINTFLWYRSLQYLAQGCDKIRSCHWAVIIQTKAIEQYFTVVLLLYFTQAEIGDEILMYMCEHSNERYDRVSKFRDRG